MNAIDIDLHAEDAGPRRGSWEFVYTADELRSAAQEKRHEHAERRSDYDQQAVALEEELRAKGVTLQEVQVTGGAQFSAKVDQELAGRLQTVRTRRDEHERRVEEYERWEHLFARSGAESFTVTIADAEYFGL